jgi:hypothetical protein
MEVKRTKWVGCFHARSHGPDSHALALPQVLGPKHTRPGQFEWTRAQWEIFVAFCYHLVAQPLPRTLEATDKVRIKMGLGPYKPRDPNEDVWRTKASDYVATHVRRGDSELYRRHSISAYFRHYQFVINKIYCQPRHERLHYEELAGFTNEQNAYLSDGCARPKFVIITDSLVSVVKETMAYTNKYDTLDARLRTPSHPARPGHLHVVFNHENKLPEVKPFEEDKSAFANIAHHGVTLLTLAELFIMIQAPVLVSNIGHLGLLAGWVKLWQDFNLGIGSTRTFTIERLPDFRNPAELTMFSPATLGMCNACEHHMCAMYCKKNFDQEYIGTSLAIEEEELVGEMEAMHCVRMFKKAAVRMPVAPPTKGYFKKIRYITRPIVKRVNKQVGAALTRSHTQLTRLVTHSLNAGPTSP